MREIKFRGKLTDADEWVFGTLLRIPHPPTVFSAGKVENDKYYIQFADPRYIPDWNMPYRMVQGEVILNTIGQYTGLKDKNGKEIYEGDIVKHNGFYEGDCYYNAGCGQVLWDDEDTGFYLTAKDTSFISLFDLTRNLDGEVIGNIYDNPELLEKEGK